MKNVKRNLKIVSFLLTFVLLVSCTGDDGADGIDGVNGTDGVNGADGADGVDGDSNVMYSEWFKPSSYTLSDGFGGIKQFDHNEAASEITQDILDTGVVLVYGDLTGYGTTIWPVGNVSLLPVTVTYSTNPTQIDTWTALLSVGNINIRMINNNNALSTLSTSHKFRYIIIPSSNSLSKSAGYKSITNELTAAGVDINNYDEVLSYYGI